MTSIPLPCRSPYLRNQNLEHVEEVQLMNLNLSPKWNIAKKGVLEQQANGTPHASKPIWQSPSHPRSCKYRARKQKPVLQRRRRWRKRKGWEWRHRFCSEVEHRGVWGCQGEGELEKWRQRVGLRTCSLQPSFMSTRSNSFKLHRFPLDLRLPFSKCFPTCFLSFSFLQLFCLVFF